MAVTVGLNCKLFRNTGTYGTPVWNEVTICRDLTFNLEKGTADASARLSTYRQMVGTLKDWSVDFTCLGDPAIDDYDELRDAFLDDTVMDLAIANGGIATTGTQYARADHQITGFTRSEPLEDVSTIDVTAILSYSSNPPVFVTV